MSMGRGALVSIARKHKLNVGSSTEAELVSIADVLGMMMWCKYFLESQGYTVESNILYQDNKSTILLAKMAECLLVRTANTLKFIFS